MGVAAHAVFAALSVAVPASHASAVSGDAAMHLGPSADPSSGTTTTKTAAENSKSSISLLKLKPVSTTPMWYESHGGAETIGNCMPSIIANSNRSTPESACVDDDKPDGYECPFQCNAGYIPIGRHVCRWRKMKWVKNSCDHNLESNPDGSCKNPHASNASEIGCCDLKQDDPESTMIHNHGFFGGRCARLCEGLPKPLGQGHCAKPQSTRRFKWTDDKGACLATMCFMDKKANLLNQMRGIYEAFEDARNAKSGFYLDDYSVPAGQDKHVDRAQGHATHPKVVDFSLDATAMGVMIETIGAELQFVPTCKALSKVTTTIRSLNEIKPHTPHGSEGTFRRDAHGFFSHLSGASGDVVSIMATGTMVAAAQFVKNYFLALPPKFIDTSCQGADCSGYDTASDGRENGTDCGSASRPVQELVQEANMLYEQTRFENLLCDQATGRLSEIGTGIPYVKNSADDTCMFLERPGATQFPGIGDFTHNRTGHDRFNIDEECLDDTKKGAKNDGPFISWGKGNQWDPSPIVQLSRHPTVENMTEFFRPSSNVTDAGDLAAFDDPHAAQFDANKNWSKLNSYVVPKPRAGTNPNKAPGKEVCLKGTYEFSEMHTALYLAFLRACGHSYGNCTCPAGMQQCEEGSPHPIQNMWMRWQKHRLKPDHHFADVHGLLNGWGSYIPQLLYYTQSSFNTDPWYIKSFEQQWLADQKFHKDLFYAGKRGRYGQTEGPVSESCSGGLYTHGQKRLYEATYLPTIKGTITPGIRQGWFDWSDEDDAKHPKNAVLRQAAHTWKEEEHDVAASSENEQKDKGKRAKRFNSIECFAFSSAAVAGYMPVSPFVEGQFLQALEDGETVLAMPQNDFRPGGGRYALPWRQALADPTVFHKGEVHITLFDLAPAFFGLGHLFLPKGFFQRRACAL